MKKETMQVVISEDVKRQFKAACVIDGASMSEVVESLVTKWLEEREKTQDNTATHKTRQKKSASSADS